MLHGTSMISCADLRIIPAGTQMKKVPSKLVFHPFSSTQADKTNALRVGGDKSRQKDEAAAKDKESSAALQESLKHIFSSPITEGLRVQNGTVRQTGIISFLGHAGDWFVPRKPEDFILSLGREIQDTSPLSPARPIPAHKVTAIDKILDKAEKTLRRNGGVLVCGGRGAGKSAALNELSVRMNNHLRCISPNHINNYRCCLCFMWSDCR
jgi:hypothetical protein